MWETSGPFVKDPSGIWVLPEGEKAVMPLSGTALGSPPTGDPTKMDWAGGFSQALAALDPSVQSYLSQQSEALGVGVGTLNTLWEETTNMRPGLVPAFDVAMKAADVVIGLANQVFGVTTTFADVSGAVSQAVGSAAGVVPLLGTVINMITGIFGFFDTEMSYAERREAQRQALQQVAQQCQSWANQSKPVGTGPEGTGHPTPADLFADIAMRGPGQPLPYGIGSVYVLMCMPETEGYGGTKADYERWKMNRVNHIPLEKRRLMWQLIKGIMAARAPRGFHRGVMDPLVTDHGKALMPYLEELVRRYGPKQGGGRGWWDHYFTRRAAFVLGGAKCAEVSGVRVCRRCDDGGLRDWWGEKIDPGIIKYETSVATQFTRSIIDWQNRLAYDINPKWKEQAEKLNAEAAAKMRALLSESGAQKMVYSAVAAEDAHAAEQKKEAEREKMLRGAAGVAGSAAAGYLAWFGVRKFGPTKKGWKR